MTQSGHRKRIYVSLAYGLSPIIDFKRYRCAKTESLATQEKLVQRGTLADESEREDQKHNCRCAEQD